MADSSMFASCLPFLIAAMVSELGYPGAHHPADQAAMHAIALYSESAGLLRRAQQVLA